MRKAAVICLTFLFFSAIGYAQQPNLKSRSELIAAQDTAYIENSSLYEEFLKNKNYDDAISSWRFIFKNYPKASKNTYINGAKIIRKFINKSIKAKNTDAANKYIDTLMMVFDQRGKYYDKGRSLGYKGIYLSRYKKNKVTEEAYGYLKEAVSILKNKASIKEITTMMTLSQKLFKTKKMEAEEIVNNFMTSMDILEFQAKKHKAKAKKLEKITVTQNNVEALFVESGAATCEVIIKVFTPKFEKTPEDIALLKKITKFLSKKNKGTDCTDSELFAKASEKLYELEPSPEAASNIAQLYAKKEDYEKASEYFKKAAEEEKEDMDKKADYFYKLALVTNKLHQPVQSRTYAREAIKLKDKWGAPYLLIATLYASSGGSCATDADASIKKFQRGAVYLVAVDMLIRAKSIDPEVSDAANKLIYSYKAGFPEKQNAFFCGFKAGQSYTVGCWINATTKIRLR